MKFAVSSNTAAYGTDPDDPARVARHAEACGFEALLFPEHLVLHPGAIFGGFEVSSTLAVADPAAVGRRAGGRLLPGRVLRSRRQLGLFPTRLSTASRSISAGRPGVPPAAPAFAASVGRVEDQLGELSAFAEQHLGR